MASPNDNISMALYCDFENVALGVRDAKYDKFDIKPVLERLLLKGSIVVKKAYCDWARYKEFKPAMHEASFELIEIPHVRQSGKNSADIRMVVDALDLCYTKAHVNTFVIISGDSDFSPLVSKLRENAKYVIGVGVKDSSSDLLISNCDEFIFIDDLIREGRRAAARETRATAQAPRRTQDEDKEKRPKEDAEARKGRAIDIAVETFDALMAERGDSGKMWASALKQAIKRRKPDFNEMYFGFRSFGNLLEEAAARGLLDVGRDDKSGTYVYRASSVTPESEAPPAPAPAAPDRPAEGARAPAEQPEAMGGHARRQGRAGRQPREAQAPAAPSGPAMTEPGGPAPETAPRAEQTMAPEPLERQAGMAVSAAAETRAPEAAGAAPAGAEAATMAEAAEPAAKPARRGGRGTRKPARKAAQEAATDTIPAPPAGAETAAQDRRESAQEPVPRSSPKPVPATSPETAGQPVPDLAPAVPHPAPAAEPPEQAAKPGRKSAARPRRPRKTDSPAAEPAAKE